MGPDGSRTAAGNRKTPKRIWGLEGLTAGGCPRGCATRALHGAGNTVMRMQIRVGGIRARGGPGGFVSDLRHRED